MKKLLLCTILIVLVSVPAAFSQFRFELGASAPLAVGFVSGSGGSYADIVTTIEEAGIIPIPNMALFLQADLGVLKIGVGAKVQSIILYSIAYPAAQAELTFGPLSVDASLGGYFFGSYAIGNVADFGSADILLPDLSVWLGIGGKNIFRIGGGAIGVISTGFDLGTLPFVAYAGVKVVLQ